jgi:hypothetical protein
MLDFISEIHHCDDITSFSSSFSSTSTSPGLSTGAAIGIGAASATVLAVGGFLGYTQFLKPMTLRDSSTQIPDFDPSLTPTGGRRSTTPHGMHGETGDPSTEFLSPAPAGRVKKNSRSRFF